MHVEYVEDLCRARIEGLLDMYSIGVLKNEVRELLEQSAAVELDLSGVSEVDSAGFQLLAMLKWEGLRAHKRVSFFNHSTAVIRLLDVYGATSLFGDPVVSPQSTA